MAGRNGKAGARSTSRGAERLVASLAGINGQYAALHDEWVRHQDRAKECDDAITRVGRDELGPAQDRLRKHMRDRGLLAAVIGGHLVVDLAAFEEGDQYKLGNYMSDSDLAVIPLDQIPGLKS
jgi:hypothetical protein